MIPLITWHMYDKATGLFTGRTFSAADAEMLDLNVGKDEGAMAGVLDWRSQRVQEGALVDYQPPRPDLHHHWDPKLRRWVIDQILLQNRQREAEILTLLKGLDERMQRPVAELQANPKDTEAIEIHSKLLAEKAKLRAELRALRETM